MRRNRKIREHRERLLKERSATVAARRRAAQQRVTKAKTKAKSQTPDPKKRLRKGRTRKDRVKVGIDYSSCPASKAAPIEFVGYKDYQPRISRPVNVVHVLESVGLGGAQTMAMELMQGLGRYYGDFCNNSMVSLTWKSAKKPPKLFRSYGVSFDQIKRPDLGNWCKKNDIDIVVHHRTSQSACLKKTLPPKTKYVIINHTWNLIQKMQEFLYCDYYVSVCRFLEKRSPFQSFIDNSRKIIILNGVENEYLKSIQPAELAGEFKTGRCHRLVSSKFSSDSLRYMSSKVLKRIPGFTHHLMGHSSEAKTLSNKMSMLYYYGSVTDRAKKMSIIKALDVYYYETYGHEGASVAILESLACGVPVLCKPFGGNNELVHNNVNGFIVADRSDFLKRMMALNENPDHLNHLKRQTISDFNNRLHIKHAACRYMQMFEKLQ